MSSRFLSHAQNMEDLRLYRALRGIENGFYVDVGANDPVMDSITKGFYELGWCGINIEPIAEWHQRLAGDRPRDINLCVAVSDVDGVSRFFQIHGSGSGLSTSVQSHADNAVATGFSCTELVVPTRKLSNILDEYSSGPIHFLKIDVEGSEEQALAGLDLGRHRPWIIVVEARSPNDPDPIALPWEPAIRSSGYDFVFCDGLNNFYVAQEHADLKNSFSLPPNVFDMDLVPAREWFARDHEPSAKGGVGDHQAARDGVNDLLAKLTGEAELWTRRCGELAEELDTARSRYLLAERRLSIVEQERAELTETIDRFERERKMTTVAPAHGPLHDLRRLFTRLGRSIRKRLPRLRQPGTATGELNPATRFFVRLRRSISKRQRKWRGLPPGQTHSKTENLPDAAEVPELTESALLVFNNLQRRRNNRARKAQIQ